MKAKGEKVDALQREGNNNSNLERRREGESGRLKSLRSIRCASTCQLQPKSAALASLLSEKTKKKEVENRTRCETLMFQVVWSHREE